MKITRKTFPSGLTLLNIYEKSDLSVEIRVAFKAGSLNDKKDKLGTAHFLEHLFFKGTTKRNSDQINEDFDKIGAVNNAYTASTRTGFYAKVMLEYADQAAEILADITQNSVFPEEEIEKERTVIFDEISRHLDDSSDQIYDLTMSNYYKKHIFNRIILGSKESVASITRDDLLDFYNKWYLSGNVVIVVVGGMKMSEAEELVLKHFEGKYKEGKNIIKIPNYKLKASSEVYSFKQSSQSLVTLAFYLKDKPKYYEANSEMAYFNKIISGGLSSRFYKRLREELGYLYSIYLYPIGKKKEAAVVIEFGASKENVPQCIDNIKKIFIDFIENGATKNEFEVAKLGLDSMNAFTSSDTKFQMERIKKHFINEGEIFNIKKHVKSIKELTFEDFNKNIKTRIDYSKVAISYYGEEIDKNLLDVWNKA